jgi:hypothetical protein
MEWKNMDDLLSSQYFAVVAALSAASLCCPLSCCPAASPAAQLALQHGGEEELEASKHNKQGGLLANLSSSLPVRVVHVPCLLAESVLLADDIPLCQKHLWT